LNHKAGAAKPTALKDNKEASKAVAQEQLEAAYRLSKGISAFRPLAASVESEAKEIAQKQLLAEEQMSTMRQTDAIDAIQYKFPVSAGVFTSGRSGRVVDELRVGGSGQIEQKLVAPPIIVPASSVKQQLFHFEPAASPSISAINESGIRGVGGTTRENNNPTLNTNSIGHGIVGRSVARAAKVRLAETDDEGRRPAALKRAVPDERQQEVALRNLFPGFF
jgi:hypothetical protein